MIEINSKTKESILKDFHNKDKLNKISYDNSVVSKLEKLFNIERKKNSNEDKSSKTTNDINDDNEINTNICVIRDSFDKQDVLVEFTPVEVIGKITDIKNCIKIINTANGSPGYRLISPISIVNNNNSKYTNNDSQVFVDLGWIPMSYDYIKELSYLESLPIKFNGVIYYGDKKIGNKNKNDLKKQMLISMHIDEIKELYNINNKNSNKIMFEDYFIKRVDINRDFNKEEQLNNINSTSKIKYIDLIQKSQFPKIKGKEELLSFYTTPEKHISYSRFWFFLTSVVSLTNCYMWLKFIR